MGHSEMGGNPRGLRAEMTTPSEAAARQDTEAGGSVGPTIRNAMVKAGAVAVGFAKAEPVGDRDMERLERWLLDGNAAGMGYMHNHFELRRDPRTLLEGARTVICAAFPYTPAVFRDRDLPHIASYAYGGDYHDVVRKRVREALNGVQERFGGDYRICIDSAPVLERYWAERSGIGEKCDNGLISVAGYGTRVFLCEVLTTLDLADACNHREGKRRHNDKEGCRHCGACRKSCPAGALQEDGTVDARRCLSYLTIEHRGEWDETGRAAMTTPAGRKTLYGCDLCQSVCPLNKGVPATDIGDFSASETLLTLDAADVAELTTESFRTLFRTSPIKRTGVAGITRNARNILENNEESETI